MRLSETERNLEISNMLNEVVQRTMYFTSNCQLYCQFSLVNLRGLESL